MQNWTAKKPSETSGNIWCDPRFKQNAKLCWMHQAYKCFYCVQNWTCRIFRVCESMSHWRFVWQSLAFSFNESFFQTYGFGAMWQGVIFGKYLCKNSVWSEHLRKSFACYSFQVHPCATRDSHGLRLSSVMFFRRRRWLWYCGPGLSNLWKEN